MMKDKKQRSVIGKVTGAVGLKGEMKIFHYDGDPDSLSGCENIWIDDMEYTIVGLRYRKKIPILKLENIDDRNGAEKLIGKDLYIFGSSETVLPDGSYYINDLKGLDVLLKADGSRIGAVLDIIKGVSQDVYEIITDDGSRMLLPAVTDYVVEVNPEKGFIAVILPDGIEDIKY